MPISPTSLSTTLIPRKTLFGDHQAYHLQGFQVDRTNLFTGKVEYHVREAWDAPDQNLLSLTAGDNVGQLAGLNKLSSGGKGYPECVGAERRYDSDLSMAIYTYTYEGIASNHLKKFYDFEIEFTMEQRQIEQHPHFLDLVNTYGPYDSLNRLWPPFVTSATPNTGFSSVTSGGAVTNPMYGITSFLSPGCVYRISYVVSDLNDTSMLQNVGTKMETPSTVDPSFPSVVSSLGATANRNWLKMAPKIRKHGSCIAITEEYMLSGNLGWFDPIYSKSALTPPGT